MTVAATSKAPRSQPGDRRYGRSAFTNGSTLFGRGVDGRSPWARLTRDTFTSLLSHCGGLSEVSETRRLAARRVSVLESELVFLENKFAQLRSAGGEPDSEQLDLYGRLADRQRRLSESLGWERTQRDVTPRLRDAFAADFEAEQAAADNKTASAPPIGSTDSETRTDDTDSTPLEVTGDV